MRTLLHLLALGLTFILLSCSEQDERLKSSQLNSNFNFDTSKNYEEYIDYSRKIIKSARLDSNSHALELNSPFILHPSKKCPTKNGKGILLIHGLSDSPFIMRDLAEYFKDNCFIVYGLLLVGHGTRPGDLLDVSYQDWIKQVEYGVKELSKESNIIYLGGFSTGGALAINYALSHSNKEISGIITLAPALNLTAFASVTPILRYFKKYLSIYDDKDLAKYESFATNAAAQIYLLTKQIKKKLKKHDNSLKNTNVFAALTYEDKTINTRKTVATLLKNTHDNKRKIIIYHRNKVSSDITGKKNLHLVSSVIKEKNILDLSHTSLPNKEDNSWYGTDGQYRNCSHYYKTRKKNDDYKACKTGDNINYGETVKDNLKKGVIARLTYNPFMEELLNDLGKFLTNN